MFPTLLRRLRESLLLVLLIPAGYQARATHLLGGELSYRFLDDKGPTGAPFRYEITANIYSNGLYPGTSGITGPPNQIQIDLYSKTTSARLFSVSAQRIGPLGNPVAPPTPSGCAVQGPSQPFYLCKYVQTVNLPVSFDGYYAVFSLMARNNTLTNINNSLNTGGKVPLTLYVSMAPPLIYNRSPVFSDTAVAIVCQNDTTISLNNAVDPDGDRLVYSFGTPYGDVTNLASFPPLPQPVPYNTGYSGTAPFGPGTSNFAIINANTGIAKYGAKTNGLYGIAVDVAEYRTINGREVLIGTTRRDLQLVVSTCPPTPPPVLPPAVTTPRSYTIEEGQSLSIPITATQATGGHPLVMTVNSALLDGTGPFNATFNGSQGTVQAGNLTGTATATGTGSVSGTFVFNSVCGNGRVTPYDMSVTVRDNGCGGKLTSDVFRITVTRAAAPADFTGPTTVRTYTATGPTSPTYRWLVVGGTIASGQGTASVNVTWSGTATTGSLSLKGVSARGCVTDSVFKNVDIRPLAVTVSATAPTICLGASTTLTVVGQAGLTYRWTGGGQTSTAISITVSPTTTTSYTVSGTDGTCSTTATFTVTVAPPPIADAGADRTICPNVTSAPLGGTPLTGATYSWSPALGLSSTTVANPTVTLPNTTGAAYVQVYTLTVTVGANCSSISTVRVTVSAPAVADAGPAVAVCPDVASGPLGTPARPGYTYGWSPATGLSNATAAQPTVTLPNTTGAPITATYTLTATSANGCTAVSSVVITMNPAVVVNPGPALSFCSGTTSAPLGGTAAPMAGSAYSWSPTTSLSDPTSLHPTVTGTNLTGAPIVRTYTLTVTTATGCVGSATVDVTINPAAVADAGPARQTCSNVGIVIGAGPAVVGTTYAWTPTTGLSSATSATPILTLPNLTGTPLVVTYTLMATTANGCTATGTVAITVNPAAVAQAGADKATCSNVATTIGTSAAVAGTTYAWSPATGLSRTSVLNPAVTLPNLTNATITQQYILLATTANGCFARDTVVVSVYPAAVPAPGTNQSVCSGGTITLGAAPLAGYTYGWNPGTGLSNTTVANPSFSQVNTTGAPITYTFTLTATTVNGCGSTGTVTVTVNPAAVADAGPDAAVCDLKTVRLGTPARTGYTYSWSPATGLSSAIAAQPVLTASNLTPTGITRTYTVTATTANGCVSTDAVVITINPRPVAESIVGPTSVCPTVTGVTYSMPNPAATDYRWLVVGGTVASGQGTPSITVDWLGANPAGAVKVYRFNAQGCSSDTTVLPVIINLRLQTVRPTGPGDIVAGAPLPRAVCQADGPYTYASGTFANGSSFSWTIVGGTQMSSSRNTVTVNWSPVTVPIIGKIVATETSNPSGGICRGVSDTLYVSINPSPRPNLAISAPPRVCAGSGPATFSLPGGFVGSSYVFKFDGNTLAGTGNTRMLATLPAPGTYTLTVQETTDAPGSCSGPLCTTQFVVAPLPVAPVISGSGFVCNTATAQQYAIANPDAGATYQWTVVGGTVTTGGTSPQVTITFNPTGPYSVSAVEVSATPNLCAGPAAIRTILLDNPSVTLMLGSVDIASNNRIVLTLSAPNNSNTPNKVQIMRRVAGSGTFASVGTVAASATTYTDNSSVDANANTYEYRLDLTNGCGTLLSSAAVQTVRLVAVASPGPGGRDQGSVSLSWNAYGGAPVTEYIIVRRLDANAGIEVRRVPGTTLQATISNTDANATASGFGLDQNFRVIAVINGTLVGFNSNSNETNVKFAGDTQVYNIITPNHDGKNDVLVIDNIQLYPSNSLAIFNRWGREVYKTTNYQNNWGQDDSLAADNYFYLLTLPDGTTRKNWFEVVK